MEENPKVHADLSEANPSEADLRGTNFVGTDLCPFFTAIGAFLCASQRLNAFKFPHHIAD